MTKVKLTWLLVMALCFSSLESKSVFSTEESSLQNFLASRINNLPEELIKEFNLFLSDPTGFSSQLMTKLIRNKRSSDNCNIEYSIESVGLTVKMSCDDPKKPLKNGRATVILEKLEDWMETKFKQADFYITFSDNSNDLVVSVFYKFRGRYLVSEEEGSFSVKRSQGDRIEIEHKIVYKTASQTFPSFSFTVNPSTGTTPLPACPFYKPIWDKKECSDSKDLEIVADEDTWFIGYFDWGSNKYQTRFQNMGNTNSKRRDNSIRSMKTKSQMNLKANGVIKDNGLTHEVLMGYSETNLQFTGVLLYDNSIVTTDNYYLKINLGQVKSKVEVHYKDQIYKTGFDLTQQRTQNIYYIYSKTGMSVPKKYIDINLNSEKDIFKMDSILEPPFPWMCKVFRFCEVYKTKGELNIKNLKEQKAHIHFSHTRGNKDLFTINGSSMGNPFFLEIQSAKYLPSHLSKGGNLFRLEIMKNGSNYSVSNSTRDDLKVWRADRTSSDDNSFNLWYKNKFLCTMNMNMNGNERVLTTRSFDDIEAKSTITKTDQKIEIKTTKGKHHDIDTDQTAEIEWNIGFSDSRLIYSNQGRNKAFENFHIFKEISFNTDKDYLNLNLKAEYDWATERDLGVRIQKNPKFDVFLD